MIPDEYLSCTLRSAGIRRLTRSECRTARLCWWCGETLTGRQVYWCGEACVEDWRGAHDWTKARADAMQRADYRCLRCGRPATEVNHRNPLVGRGYHAGCVHHEGPVSDVWSLKVSREGDNSVGIVVQHPKCGIACRAKNATDSTAGMVVIYVRTDLGEARLADGTRVILRNQDGSILRFAKAVEQPQVGGLEGTLLGAKASISPALERAQAHIAEAISVEASAYVSPVAALGAVPKVATVQWTAAVDALRLMDREIAFPPSPYSSVAGATEASSGVGHGAGATGDSATHVTIVVCLGVPYDALPRNGGLEPLCHPCHTAETVRQLHERKQARVDAGTDYHGRKARKRLGLPPIPSTPTPGFRRDS